MKRKLSLGGDDAQTLALTEVKRAAFTCWNNQSFHLLTLSFTVPCGWLPRLTAAIGYYNTLSQSVPGFEQADLAELKKLS